MKRSAVMTNSDVDTSTISQPLQRRKPRVGPVSVRNGDMVDKRGFIPLITQEELEKSGLNIGDSTLDDVEITNNFLSPNISGINSNNTSGTSTQRKVNRSRKHNLSEDMNNLSVIQKANNGDSLNQTNLDIIRKMQSKTNNGNDQSDVSESDTSINKMGTTAADEKAKQQKRSILVQDEEQSDVNFKLETFDLQSTNSHIFNEEELLQYEDHIQQKINDVWVNIQKK